MRMWIPRLHLVHWGGLREQSLRQYAVLVVRGGRPPNEEVRAPKLFQKPYSDSYAFTLIVGFQEFSERTTRGFRRFFVSG